MPPRALVTHQRGLGVKENPGNREGVEMSGGHADHVSSVGLTGLVVVPALLVAAGWSSAPRRKAQEKVA